MLKVGIVGLPNVGKSTLFNALTRSRKAQAENYPFCTIEPNVGTVEVPDARLKPLSKLVNTQKIIPAAIEFVDIAGLVKGASEGEGLGNKFLSHIRQVDAIVHVVRCFEDENIVHEMGRINPVDDLEVIQTELILADLESVKLQIERNERKAKGRDKEAMANVERLKRVEAVLNEGRCASALEVDKTEEAFFKHFGLITSKPALYACNVNEDDVLSGNAFVDKLRAFVTQSGPAHCCVMSAQLEAELSRLEPAEAQDYLSELGLEDSGVSRLIRESYSLLGLASYFTAGEQEVRAWTFTKGMKAPQCAGVIHTDFERGFIKAEVIQYETLMQCGGFQGARDQGKLRLEGKDYRFEDGDVAHFRFNV